MKILYLLIFVAVTICSSSCRKKDYRDASLAPEERANLLLAEMTLEEKVAQLHRPGEQRFVKDDLFHMDTLKKHMPYGTGIHFMRMYGTPVEYATKVNVLQKYLVENTRLGIPALFGGEGLHGFMAEGATYFPQAIALGCSFDTELAEKVYAAAALEMRSRGVTQVLSPVIDLARDPRWGRTEECFSEDPYLVAQFGLAAVRGFQGRKEEDLRSGRHVIATLKHFVGHGQPEGGRNIAPVASSMREVREMHMYPFEVCVKQGRVLSVMASYNDLNGVPNHANKWLLTDVLRNEWDFNGYIIGDAGGVDELFMVQGVAKDKDEAAKLAIEAGIDLDLVRHINSYRGLGDLVKSGRVDVKHIDRAVYNLLVMKFRMGLFENPYIDPEKVISNTAEHKQLALEAALKSVVLLKNQNGILPLNYFSMKSIAVIGPNAADVHLGGYTSDPHVGVSVLDGIKAFCSSKNMAVNYAEGCKITKQKPSFWGDDETPNDYESDSKLIQEAVGVASKSDVILLVLGDNVSTCREAWGENHRGDRDNLNLLGRQDELVDKIASLGKPVVALMLGGRPLSFLNVDQKVPAIFQGFYMGQEGGHAFARLLFGEENPSGKLSITIPRNAGQLPAYYNHKPSLFRSYLWSDTKPLYPFGHGLSYTGFVYSGLKQAKTTISANENLKVSFVLKNTGIRKGTEVVQLYIRDKVASVTRPVMELKDFKRVALNPGEETIVHFEITPDKLSFFNQEMTEKIIEPGEFDLMIGSSSADIRLKATFNVK